MASLLSSILNSTNPLTGYNLTSDYSSILSTPYSFYGSNYDWTAPITGLATVSTGTDTGGGGTGSSWWDWFTQGTGKNSNWGELANIGLGLVSLLNSNSQWEDQYDLALQQLAYQKALSNANFNSAGTSYLDDQLFKLQSLYAFNNSAGDTRASTLYNTASQLQSAADSLGATGFSDQIQSIADLQAKYGSS